jgi:hypothetical protein
LPTLQKRNSVTVDRRKVLFSPFCRAVLSLFMTSLRRIQNLASFGRSGVGNVSPVTIFEFSLILEPSNSVTLDRRKVMFSAFSRVVRPLPTLFSAFCRAILPLLTTSLRRIQNLSRFGRLGVGNVSPLTIDGIFTEVSAR